MNISRRKLYCNGLKRIGSKMCIEKISCTKNKQLYLYGIHEGIHTINTNRSSFTKHYI